MSTLKSNQTITPFLWFDGRAEEAMEFYTSIFPNSSINAKRYWAPGSGFRENWIMYGNIVLDGLNLYLFDAGPEFKFNESVSLFVTCPTQQVIDDYWDKLIAGGGSESQCGWLKDKFGLSWQIVPAMLEERLRTGDPGRIVKMSQALYKMKKLDMAELERAYKR